MVKKNKNIYKIIRVTTTTDYFVEEFPNGQTSINGSTIKEVVKEWFEDYPIEQSHATRDSYRIGNSRKVIKTEIVEDGK